MGRNPASTLGRHGPGPISPAGVRPARRGQHKPPSCFNDVAVLVADVVDSTSLLRVAELRQRSAIEVLTEILNPVLEICRKHGGLALESHGDSVFVVFPQSSGVEDALAAVQALMSAHRSPTHGEPLRGEIRIGLGFGRVEFGEVSLVGLHHRSVAGRVVHETFQAAYGRAGLPLWPVGAKAPVFMTRSFAERWWKILERRPDQDAA